MRRSLPRPLEVRDGNSSRGENLEEINRLNKKSRFAMQSQTMQTDWASENLQVIRTLMERGAVYRRALAPVMGAGRADGHCRGGAGGGARRRGTAPRVRRILDGGGGGLPGGGVSARSGARRSRTRSRFGRRPRAGWRRPSRRPSLRAGGGIGLFDASSREARWRCGCWCRDGWCFMVAPCTRPGFSCRAGSSSLAGDSSWRGCLSGGGAVPGGTRPRQPESIGPWARCSAARTLAYGLYLHFTEKRGNAA